MVDLGRDQSRQDYCLALVDEGGWRLGSCLDEDTPLTFFAVASEDPANWQEIAAYWPRYATPVVPEFVDALPLRIVDQSTARKALVDTDRWLVIDLVRKRISTGSGFGEIGRDQVFAMNPDEEAKPQWLLSIHLPPWWELHEQTAIETIDRPRVESIDRPRPNRAVLFGRPMMQDLARRILQIARSQRWQRSGAADDPKKRYPLTVEVHRDWLMTPRDDLGGKMPRQMLHGASEWIERLTWAQRVRFEDGGKLVAAPTDVLDFDDAPMGREEICIYFDLCRELIETGWDWCSESLEDLSGEDPGELTELETVLADAKNRWLGESLEGGSPPRFIIECSRRRVPRGSNVEIQGMDEREVEEHVLDCDCPMCAMMADGLLGVGFVGIDGHHLELDDEFAFSLCETREEWEEQQRGFEGFCESVNYEQAQLESETSQRESDEFSSVWAGHVSDEPIPGDTEGHLKLAFLLAEIVSTLQARDISSGEIQELNECFRDFRSAKDAKSRQEAAGKLKQCLEQVASLHGELVSRVADFQSRIDESILL